MRLRDGQIRPFIRDWHSPTNVISTRPAIVHCASDTNQHDCNRK